MRQKSQKCGLRQKKAISLTIALVLLLNLVFIVIPTLSPSASAYIHGAVGFSSTADEDNGPNDANPAPFQVRWDASSDHFIEGNYTVSSGYPLTIDPGCNIFFNGLFGITVSSTLFAQGTSGNRITFTTNNSIPGHGNWSSIDFTGGGGTLEYCDIHYATDGIHLDSVAAITINENKITHNTIGINGTHPSVTLMNNNITNNNQSGIRLLAPSSGLTFYAEGNTVANNTGLGGVEIYSDQGFINADFFSNEVSGNIDNGIYIESIQGDITSTLQGNTISHNGYDGNEVEDNGIYLYSISGDVTTTFEGNTILNNGFEGIYLIAEGATATLDATIINNDVIGNFYGIWLSDNTMWAGTNMIFNISRNNIFDNGDGIYVDGRSSVNAEIWNNNMTNNTETVINCQIDDDDSQYKIIDNFFWKNGGTILIFYISFSLANRTLSAEITDNKFIQNTISGIDLWSDEYLDFTLARNEFIENEYPMFASSVKTLQSSIYDNYFNNNVGSGIDLIAIDDISLQMTNNSIFSSSDDNLYLYTMNGGDFEIIDNEFSSSLNANGVYIDHFNVSGIFSDNILTNNDQSGIDFWEGKDIIIRNSTFSNNQYGLTAYNSYINITNSSISSSLNDFNLYGNSHFTALNTTFDNTSAIFGDFESDLTVKWFLDIHVVDNLGSGVDDALIYLNESKGATEWSGSSGIGNDGWVYYVPATEYIENSTSKDYKTPHNVSAFKGPDSGWENPKIWESRDVTITLNSLPVAENIWPEGGISTSVFRGDTIYIHANASDLTDPENLLTPYFEYRDPKDLLWNTSLFSGPATYMGFAPSGYWTIPFSPGFGYSELGPHDFRVRFSDTIGAFSDHAYYHNSVDVRNNLPEAISLSSVSSVFRGDSIVISADGLDREDAEDEIVPIFEYLSSGSGTWEISYFGSPTYNYGQSSWEITFTTPLDAQTGFYDFRVRFNDSDGGQSDNLEELDLLDVVNNIPSSIDIHVSSPSVFRTQTVFIFGNSADVEESEDMLNPHFEYKEPGGTIWTSSYLFNPQYIGGEWRVDFTPPFDAPLGTYDLRVRFNDADLDYSPWIYENSTVVVSNNVPVAINISVSGLTIERGRHIFIFANGSDSEDLEKDLSCEFQYRITGGVWENISFSGKIFYQGHWQVQFTPNSEMTLGTYEFRVGFYDSEEGFSNWLSLSQTIIVENRAPYPTTMNIGAIQIYRTETVLIYAKANDFEDELSELTASFQYSVAGSLNWIDLNGVSYNSEDDRFEVSFTPSESWDPGEYDFRFMVTDSDSQGSIWLYRNESLVVLNNIPSVVDIALSGSELYRGEDLVVYSNGEDAESDEEDLVPTFEYSIDSSTWETNYLGEAMYENDRWQITFSPPYTMDPGILSFRVKLSDPTDESKWMYLFNSLDLKNIPPEVEITTAGLQEEKTVSFSATVSDPEDSPSSLIYLWNFGDGETSSSRNPTHVYENPGTYTVTLTITDSEGGDVTDIVQIEIQGESGSDIKGDSYESFPLWIFLIVILVIVVLILFLFIKRKKPVKGEMLPPETMAPQIQHQLVEVAPSVPSQPIDTQPHAPPQAPTPAPIPDHYGLQKEKTEFKKNIKCPQCHETFQIPFKKGTQKVTCPHCGISGNISL
jgi:hypothetical protein